MITSMKRSLCSAVNAQSYLAHQSARYDQIGNSALARVDSILENRNDASSSEKVITYDMGEFQIIEYIYFGTNPIGFLWLEKKSNGERLELMKLLPEKFYFSPQALKGLSSKEVMLAEYDCKNNNVKNRFSTDYDIGSNHGVVLYRDITRTGGMFSFLHEIVHVWQTIFWPIETQAMSYVNTSIQGGDFDGDIDKFNRILSKCGKGISLRSIDKESQITGNTDISKLVLATNSSTFVFESKSDSASKLLKMFLWREKHAWLVAMHLLEQLRKKFLNIEPTLSRLELQQYAQNSLQTHITSVNYMLRYDWREVR